ncbi:CBS domain-containing protein [Halosegnis marinus]|uniref:CBS domain-containing protein n=1 Tax=Halosegnis marinus TaxID=3034023 RepID=A0ABD5ZK21_9EURY|nr:CBS domain-containing protein [Halosegnis sp. DT85]
MDLPTPADLREKRKALELTQSALADRADVSQPLIARIEGGDVDPRLSTLRRIVTALEEAEGNVLKARDLMHEEVVAVSPDDSVREAARVMDEDAYSQLPVLEHDRPVGSISQTDLVGLGEESREKPVSEHMSESFPTVAADASIDEVRHLLEYYKAVMVTESGEAVGIITEADVASRLS